MIKAVVLMALFPALLAAALRLAPSTPRRPRGAAPTVASLVHRLEDPDFTVRRGAARALGRLGAVEARPALRRALEDVHADVRREAERALRGASR